MNDMRYFGQYVRFDTVSKQEGLLLTNADNIIGSEYTVSFEVENGKTTAWMVNRFGAKVGYLSSSDTYTLDVLRAREWNIHALLSVILYTEGEDEDLGSYWGEMIVVACPERYEQEIVTYLDKVKETLASGVRPRVDLTELQIDELMSKRGDWVSPDHQQPYWKEKGTAVVKDEISLTEKLIEEGRKGNTGCYIASWIFIAVLVAGVGYLAAKLLGLI